MRSIDFKIVISGVYHTQILKSKYSERNSDKLNVRKRHVHTNSAINVDSNNTIKHMY